MYNAQAQCILDLEPDTLCLEQVAHIMNVDKSAVTELINQLEAKYVMYSSIINCWVYGDPCNRERLIIVGIHRKFGALAESYSIPRGEYHSGRAPQAWMVADKDSDVPPCMWRNDKIYNTTWRDPSQDGFILSALPADTAWASRIFRMQSTHGNHSLIARPATMGEAAGLP